MSKCLFEAKQPTVKKPSRSEDNQTWFRLSGNMNIRPASAVAMYTEAGSIKFLAIVYSATGKTDGHMNLPAISMLRSELTRPSRADLSISQEKPFPRVEYTDHIQDDACENS